MGRLAHRISYGLMRVRHASSNDFSIEESDRKYEGPIG